MAALGTGVLVEVVPQRYTAEAKVLLESGETKGSLDEATVAGQVQVVLSREIARQAIRSLALVGNAEFDPIVGEIGALQRVLIMLGLTKNPLAGPPEERIFDAYFDRLHVTQVGQSQVLAIAFRSGDPELAAKAANTVADLYVAALAAPQDDAARAASTLLNGTIETLRGQVLDAEARLETFRARNGLIGGGGNALPRAQQLTEMSGALTQARATRADLVGRVKVLKDMIKEGRAYEVADVANNALIRRTVENRITVRAQLALESRALLPGHPRIKDLTVQAAELDAQIKLAAERIVRGLEDDAKIASARVESLQTVADNQSSVVGRGNTGETELRALEREVKSQRDQFDAAVAAHREAAARDGTQGRPSEARIVARALVPEAPYFPKKLPTLAAATAVAFLLSAGAVAARRFVAPSSSARSGEAPGEPQAEVATEPKAESVAEVAPAADPDRLIYPEPLPPGAQHDERESEPVGLRGPVSMDEARFEPRFDDHVAVPVHVSHDRPDAPILAIAAPEEADAPDAAPAAEPSPTADASLAAAAAFWEAVQTEAAAVTARPPQEAPADGAYDFQQLIARLEAGPRHGGRSVLVVETTRRQTDHDEATMVESLARVLAARDRTLWVDVNGRRAPDDPGLSDVVAAHSVFLDVIHRFPGTRMHAIGPGSLEADTILDELEGLAIAFHAMAQAYEWVICRIDAAAGEPVHGLISAVAASMDAVVIVSEADGSEDDLVALYNLAEEAGAAQVLIAQGWAPAPPERDAVVADGDMALRLSAA